MNQENHLRTLVEALGGYVLHIVEVEVLNKDGVARIHLLGEDSALTIGEPMGEDRIVVGAQVFTVRVFVVGDVIHLIAEVGGSPQHVFTCLALGVDPLLRTELDNLVDEVFLGRLMRGVLPRQPEIFVEDHERNQAFALLVLELPDPFVGMLHDGFGLFGVSLVVVDAFDEVVIVCGYLDVVIVGYELPFHVPCLACRAWHDGDRVAGHHPFEIRCDVVALDGHDVA